MKMPKLKYRGTIMVDIDGVLADWETPMCDAFGYINRHMYSPYDRYPDVPRDLIDEYISNPHSYEDLAPIFGGILFCRQATMRGWYVLLCTSRPDTASVSVYTENWLRKYGVSYNELRFSKNKRKEIENFDSQNPDKPVRIVVDDSVSVLQSMPDKYCVAWMQEWNKHYLPTMYYSSGNMKVMIKDAPENTPVGAWDIVGKR